MTTTAAATTDPQFSPQSRNERLITTGRVVLAASSLFAIWLDPLQPAKYVEAAYTLMSVYVVYSVLIAAMVWNSPLAMLRLSLVTHVVDIAVFALFVLLTEGPPTSPFYVYFVFSILCATLRWGWRGTLWTTLVALAVFIGFALSSGGAVLDDEKLNRFIIRSVYLTVIAVMLGYLGAYEQQLRGEVARLATWPRAGLGETRDVLRETLRHAAQVFGAPRVLMVWEEPEEPWITVAAWQRDHFSWEREAPGKLEPLVAEELSALTFFCRDLAAEHPMVVTASGAGTFRRWRGAPIHRELRERYAMRAVLSLPLGGGDCQGRLFFLDKLRMNADDAMLGEIVARQVVTDVEHLYLQQRLQQAAVMEERVRFARDLHDGLLQSLTGTALQLQTIRRLLRDDPETALERLDEIQHLIVAEQRNLRSYIRELRPAALLASRAQAALVPTLRALAGRIERQWGLGVELQLGGELKESEVGGLAHHVTHIVHEALVNAARHGGASSASVSVAQDGAQVRITVADNGRGFPFHGRYDLAALNDMGAGPVTLKERIAALRGMLVITSGASGARLDIVLPCAPARA